MNSGRIVLSAVAATVAYNLFGFLVFGLFPGMADYYRAYPGVFRPKETIHELFSRSGWRASLSRYWSWP